MVGRVEGKVAFITGAARGQGRSHAVRLAEEGADIIAVDLCETVPEMAHFYAGATSADLDETVRLVEATGRKIIARKADVRNVEALGGALAEGIAELGRLDIVVANAGVFGFGQPAHETPASVWQTQIDINQTGVWNTATVAIPHLLRQGQGGSMIFTSSMMGLKGGPYLAAYSASKHAVVGMMKSIAGEVGYAGIRVNSVHPSSVETDMVMNEATRKLFRPDLEHPTKEDVTPAAEGIHLLPLGWLQPIDISNAVLFLASDEARFVTGSELKVDAGATAK